ncbi:helix-turn-helix domain-containing protein [Pedobacter aquatilis]|uniref:AraC family transcriptional regulator n=1 Tax=Pedobacter aquatilis TaxID=351343 RepID=UPI0025B45AB6|nr:helix-turn-helix domain-containing protein [Pedobacter aquatilis]MDN3586459.1 helix-turn-helix domain-containing protein [Pedobacter aquatilis]
MESQLNLRNLYTPIQPTVKQLGSAVSYIEILPDSHLQPYIYCFWELETNHPLTEQFNYRVVADGCIDIFFDLNNPNESYVMGFCKKYTEFELGNLFHYVGIRFLPTMFPMLFNINAKDLSNLAQNLDGIIPSIAKFISDNFTKHSTKLYRANLLNTFFKNYINHHRFTYDSRVQNAINIILKNFGVLNIEKDLDVGLSSRQLRRLFEYYIGDSQKAFCQVVRFQNILKAKPSLQSLKANKLFLDQGYHDQAHFIKNFKNFYGVTPKHAFRK